MKIYVITLKTKTQYGILLEMHPGYGGLVPAHTHEFMHIADHMCKETLITRERSSKHSDDPLNFLDEVEVRFHEGPSSPDELEKYFSEPIENKVTEAQPVFVRGVPIDRFYVTPINDQFEKDFPVVYTVNEHMKTYVAPTDDNINYGQLLNGGIVGQA